MPSDDLAVVVEDLTKTYRIFDHPADRIKQALTFGRVRWHHGFTALSDVSFTVSKGETVGIIGRNGSGKSTLLQVVCGILKPTSGKVRAQGRISAMLELGTGFHPDFTGKENAYFQGAILGISAKSMDERFASIAAFADIGDFMLQPVRTYSSGMFARLAFSVAVHLTPDILIVDEVLSVGDMAFQEKAISHMKKIRQQGAAILFVSHSLPAVRNFCDKAIWLDHGRVRAAGERLSVCEAYQEEIRSELAQASSFARPRGAGDGENSPPQAESTRTLAIRSVRLDKESYAMGETIRIAICLDFLKKIEGYGLGVLIYDAQGRLISVISTIRDDIVLKEPLSDVQLLINDNHFVPGVYSVDVSICDDNVMFSYDKLESCATFSVSSRYSSRGVPVVEGCVRCDHEWQF